MYVIEKSKRLKKNMKRKFSRECKDNHKSFWKYVQSKTKVNLGVSPLLTSEGDLAVTDVDKAKVLNNFFASIFTQEDLNDIPIVEVKHDSSSLLEILVTPSAVKDKLQSLNPNKAQGPDMIPPRVLKELSDELAVPLCNLFNKSLESGEIPNDWKNAVVTAIFKKGTRSEPGNYRPVSLTCVVCKLLESIIRDILVNFMSLNMLYSPCQHGFRKH